MARRRFYAPPDRFASDGLRVTLGLEEARHLRDVLRLEEGDEVFVFDGKGAEFRCVVEKIERNSASLVVSEKVAPVSPESPLRLTLALALLKGEKFDLAVQKATELGVTGILPVATELADIRLRNAADSSKRVGRWQRIAVEAAKQCGRATVPDVSSPITFETLIGDVGIGNGAVRLLFAERGGRGLYQALDESPFSEKAVIALVGPEGGWTAREIQDARAVGWSIVTLGGRTLRAETAAIVITALLQHLRGDLGWSSAV